MRLAFSIEPLDDWRNTLDEVAISHTSSFLRPEEESSRIRLAISEYERIRYRRRSGDERIFNRRRVELLPRH